MDNSRYNTIISKFLARASTPSNNTQQCYMRQKIEYKSSIAGLTQLFTVSGTDSKHFFYLNNTDEKVLVEKTLQPDLWIICHCHNPNASTTVLCPLKQRALSVIFRWTPAVQNITRMFFHDFLYSPFTFMIDKDQDSGWVYPSAR